MPAVLTGLDVLHSDKFSALRGKRLAVITNQSAINAARTHLLELLLEHEINIVRIFSPEHGLGGKVEAGAAVEDHTYGSSGVAVLSLYGKTKQPTAEQLANIDLVLFDMQDVGVRFFTYISTMLLCMEAAFEAKIPFLILDRPNPIGGTIVEGPMLEDTARSFVGMLPVALRHGMTIGEVATFIQQQKLLRHDGAFEVIKMQHWKRSMLFSECALPWINPSPNIFSPECALLYPALALLEATNVSEGRGTTEPFMQVGAPWIESARLLDKLSALTLPGVSIDSCDFIPQPLPGRAEKPRWSSERCFGVRFKIENAQSFRSLPLGLGILVSLHELYADTLTFDQTWLLKLSGSEFLYKAIKEATPAQSLAKIESSLEKFKVQRDAALLYGS